MGQKKQRDMAECKQMGQVEGRTLVDKLSRKASFKAI